MLKNEIMDRIDWEIVALLQQNGRMSFSALGRKVKLTPPAVIERVRQMEDAGIIVGYRADVSPAKLGFPILAFVRMSIGTDVRAQIIAVAKNSPEVIECHRGTGGDSFTMKVVARSMEHLSSLIDRLTPYGVTSTSIVLSSPVERGNIVAFAADTKLPKPGRSPAR